MKFLLILVALAFRELATAEWQRLVSQPLRSWRIFILRHAGRRGLDGQTTLALAVGLPALALICLLLGTLRFHFGLWDFLLSALVLVPVFVDRVLPPALVSYRQAWLAVEQVADAPAQLRQARRELLGSQLRELFTPLFWFLLLGPLPVLIHYLTRQCAREGEPDVRAEAERWLFWLEWLPAQTLVLSFGLAGSFVAVWDFWRAGYADLRNTEDYVVEAALLAEPPRDGETTEGPLALVNALDRYESLCHRALVIWIVLLFLHVVMS